MEPKVKVSELFFSCQGEGQYVGVPSIFLRTFGCNFTCGGFGMPLGQISTERDVIAKDINKYHEYKSLPLVSSGCDSYSSWDPRFKKLSAFMTIGQIVDKFVELLPDGQFSMDKHLIITGGEPLLGWQKFYPKIINETYARKMNLSNLTFETNGTQPLSDELFEFLSENSLKFETTFSISAKLPCSGEPWDDAIKPEIVSKYLKVKNNRSYFKFVVSTKNDIDDAKKAVDTYKKAGIDIPVYLMPVGGVNKIYQLNERQVADYCRDHGFRFSPRIHVNLYKNAWGT